MGYSTTPITVEEGRGLINTHGEVVSASLEYYFNNADWEKDIETAEIADDGITVFFTLFNRDFIEYCIIIKPEKRSDPEDVSTATFPPLRYKIFPQGGKVC